MEQKLKALHPGFAKVVLKIVQYLKDEHQIDVTIAQGMRTIAEQNALYAQGRTKPGKRVTNARGGSSFHNYGIAVDICLASPVMEKGKPTQFPDKHPLWNAIGEACKKFELTWGGNFKSIKDRPHVEVPFKTIAVVRDLYAKGGMDSVWRETSVILKSDENGVDVQATEAQ